MNIMMEPINVWIKAALMHALGEYVQTEFRQPTFEHEDFGCGAKEYEFVVTVQLDKGAQYFITLWITPVGAIHVIGCEAIPAVPKQAEAKEGG